MAATKNVNLMTFMKICRISGWTKSYKVPSSKIDRINAQFFEVLKGMTPEELKTLKKELKNAADDFSFEAGAADLVFGAITIFEGKGAVHVYLL